jgi:DNA-binding beta-propeller fold protein YncE
MSARIARLLAAAVIVGALGTAPASAFEYLGSFGTRGSGPGQLSDPRMLAIDREGTVWVADELNSRIEVFTAGGRFVRTFGSAGSGNGQFLFPTGVGFDGAGNLYVADTGNSRVQVFAPDGTFLRKWGGLGFGGDRFAFNEGLAVTADGIVYVLNFSTASVNKYDAEGHLLARWSGHFVLPAGVATDTQNNVYVADGLGNKVVKLSRGGTVWQTFGSPGLGSGQFLGPSAVAVDTQGNVYVTDLFGSRLQKFAADGRFLGSWGGNGTGPGQLIEPWGVAVDCHGTVYVSDTGELLGGRGRVEKFGEPGTPDPPCDTAPRATAPRAMRVSVAPARVRAGETATFRLRVTSPAPACRRARVRFAGGSVIAGADGRARITRRLRHPGRYTLRAATPGCTAATTTVTAVR